MTFALLLQYLVAGVTYGAIYAIVAIGFGIVYNATGIINFAQGEFVMLGGMIAVSLQEVLPLPSAIVVAVLITMGVGALIEILFIRWLDRPTVLRMIVITIGISIGLRELALWLWGEGVHSLPYFTGDAVTALSVGDVHVSPQVLWVLATVALISLFLMIFFGRTRVGRQMRACAANRDAARLCGIDAKGMVTLSFVLAAGIGALAGCVVSPITYVQYDSGTNLAIKGFTVAVLGGLGNSAAALGGGLILGIAESLSILILPAAYKDIVAIALLLLILVFRPAGVFSNPATARLQEHA
jgi:branched-chain amino acid transport system permease protein